MIWNCKAKKYWDHNYLWGDLEWISLKNIKYIKIKYQIKYQISKIKINYQKSQYQIHKNHKIHKIKKTIDWRSKINTLMPDFTSSD